MNLASILKHRNNFVGKWRHACDLQLAAEAATVAIEDY